MKNTIYFENRKLVFCENYIDDFLSDSGFFIKTTSSSDVAKILNFFENTPSIKTLHLFGSHSHQIFEKVKKNFIPVSAAGGLVKNTNGEFLLIERNDVWDLPKGKVEANETPKEAALREVSEECGINGLTIISELGTTLHTYTRDNKKYLKQTHWFEMVYSGNGNLTPQKSEGITQAIWVQNCGLYPKLKRSYGSIREVFHWIGIF